MTTKDRIVHVLLFEGIALLLFVPLAMLLTQEGAAKMTWLSVMLSIIAMIWNYLYNLLVDWMYGENRAARGFLMRIGHSIGFEFGMFVLSFPILVLMLNETFLTVLWMDFGVFIFFFFYTIIFNWIYDLQFQKRRQRQ